MAYLPNVVNGVFGISLILIIYINVRRFRGNSTVDLQLRACLAVAMTFGITDTVSWLLMDRNFPGVITLSYITNILALCSMIILSYMWLCYVYFSLYETTKKGIKIIKCVAVIPIAVCTFIALTPLTHAVFYISDTAEYIRGDSFYFVYLGSGFGTLFASSILALIRRKKEITRSARRECLLFSSFIIIPVFDGVMQGLFYGINLAVAGLALSIVLVFLNQQNQQQSLDALTKINNRSQFDYFMDKNFKASIPLRTTYLMMMDINKFKKINDTYGHMAGDEAIVAVADSLKEAFAATDAFIARYGGDEFVVVMQSDDEHTIRNYCKKTNEVLGDVIKERKLPYELTLSIGYTMFGADGVDSIEKLINDADNKMYDAKRSAEQK